MRLMVAMIVGIQRCVVLIEAMPEFRSVKALVPWKPMIPEKRDMVFRPKGAVLKKAISHLGSVINSKIGVWEDLGAVTRGIPELEKLREEAAITMIGSKANSTLQAYLPYTAKWAEFAAKYGFEAYPAGQSQFMLFVQSLISQAKERGNKTGVVTTAVYAVDFVHQIMGLPKPGEQNSIKLMLEGAKRMLARPVVRKAPLSIEAVKKLIRHFTPDLQEYTLKGLRYSVYCALAFVLEARFDDIINICPDNIVDYGDRMVVFLEENKTDQYREGAFVPFVNSGEPLGVYALVTELLDRLPMGQNSKSIFRRVNSTLGRGEFFRDECMSYSLVREGIKKALVEVGENAADYALHSFKSGAKSHVDRKQKGLPEGERIPERLSNKHGRWVAGSKAALGYTADDAEDQLLVPNALRL